MNTKSKPAHSLPALTVLLDEARGTYIPQAFVRCDSPDEWHVSEENREILDAGESHDLYWDAWDEVLDDSFYEIGGFTWRLYQDGSLFAICEELMTDKEKADFFGE